MGPAHTERHRSACRSQGYWRLPRAAAQVEARAAKSAGGKSVKKRKRQKKNLALEPTRSRPDPDQVPTRSETAPDPGGWCPGPNGTEPNRTGPDRKMEGKEKAAPGRSRAGGQLCCCMLGKSALQCWGSCCCITVVRCGYYGMVLWDEGVCVRVRVCRGAQKDWSGGEVKRG